MGKIASTPLRYAPPLLSRELKMEYIRTDLCVVGGGLAGTCAAITAARAGIHAVLIQDRPVLGGNASSEVRLWTLGATSHMGNNNRWAREGGVINEIMTENLYRNPEGNPLLFDALLLEKASSEPNLTLLLNTAVFSVDKKSESLIAAVRSFNSQNSMLYEVSAPLFLDASGDGIVGFLSGAAFRIGQESRGEFGEPYAPEKPSADLLGHSLYFMSKNIGHPTRFIPPVNALDMETIRKIRRYRGFSSKSQACNFWWLEYGGHLDTIYDSEKIKQELWRVVYGVWNYIKNSGEFPEAETMTLEWIGQIPGKRESRRFEGDYILIQQDLIEQRCHPDAVSYGGWAIDHHPVEGLYSEQAGCTQWHSKGIYQIPYRALYSRNVENLFLGGRLISASHIAFGSTRVMATCAHSGQACGMAAALCMRNNLLPRGLLESARMEELHRELLRTDQYIPGKPLTDPDDLATAAKLSATSTCRLDRLVPNGQTQSLTDAMAIMLPVQPGPLPLITFTVNVPVATELVVELRISSKPDNHTPDVILETIRLPVKQGFGQNATLCFSTLIDQPRYAFICLMSNPAVFLHLSNERRTGIVTVYQKFNEAVAKTARQDPPKNSGIDSFEFWIPQRRPAGKNPAIEINPPLDCFQVGNLCNGWTRPVSQANAWVADPADPAPALTLDWNSPQSISRIDLFFDGDYDHPMETVLWGHPEREIPFCVRRYRILDGGGRVLADIADNHQAHNIVQLEPWAITQCIRIEELHTEASIPPAVFEVKCFGPAKLSR
jgi:hypothetical protein